MEQYCTKLYRQLQNDLEDCMHSKLSCNEIVESCFGIAVKKWMELRENLVGYQFVSEQKEIEFFKTMKPKFTLEIEYYNLVYHSILFRPDEPKSLLHFWGREYGRLRKFKTENKLFLQCYNSDQNKEIPYFYLQKHFTLESADSTARIYDSDASVSTNGDRLTAMLLALEKYRDYAAEKLENL